MRVILNLKEETRLRLEEKANAQGVKLEEMLENAVEEMATISDEKAVHYATDEDFDAVQKEVFGKYARAFEALAEGAK